MFRAARLPAINLRIEKRDRRWRAVAEGVPGVWALEPTY